MNRNNLYFYMDLETREQYIAHREDFDQHVNQWKLTEEARALFARATEVVWDVETIPVPPVGTYQHLTDGVRKKLGLTYLTELTHIAFYSVVDGQEVAVVLVAPFSDEEEAFMRWLIEKEDKLDIGHNQPFDVRITCGHHDIQPPKQTYCTLVAQTTMMGSPKPFYPDGSTRSLDSLMKMYGVQDKIVPYVVEAAFDWAHLTVDEKKQAQFTSGYGYIANHAAYSNIIHALGEKGEVVLRLVEAWQSFMKDHRDSLHTLPAKWVSAYAISDSVGTYWVYRAQMYYASLLQTDYGYDALPERMRKDQQYQNVLNRWIVRGMPVNREWMQQQLELIRDEKKRLIPYFMDEGCGDLTKSKQKFRYLFHVCHCPAPDPWEYVEFKDGRGKWYPAEMQNSLWTQSAYGTITKDGWKKNHDYSNWYSTGSDAVKYYLKFAPEEHRSKLALYDYYTSMLSMEDTYQEWLSHSAYDGKIHPMLTMTANSGRTIGDSPNTLNVPLHKPHQLNVYDPATGEVHEVLEFTGRGMLAPHPGKVLLEFDASNAEVRFAAVIAKARGLATAFAEKRDLHRENAAAFYRVAVEEVTKDQRTNGKPIFFAMQYGGGPRTIAGRVHYPVAQVTDMVRGWEKANLEVGRAKKWIEDDGWRRYQRMQSFPIPAARQAYTVLYNGRWVPAPMAWGRPKLYTLWNSQQQGGVAGIVQEAIINIQRELDGDSNELDGDNSAFPDCGMYIMYHDSIIAEVPEDDEPQARAFGELIARELSTQVPLDLTVVDGIPVPWPSGCDLFENKDKWGWRPGQDFPFYCGEDEGEVVITFPEDQAWGIMQQRALTATKQELKDLERAIKRHYQHAPFKQFVWYDAENETHTCISWKDTVQYSPEAHYAQARYWGNVLKAHHTDIDAGAQENVRSYRAWVSELQKLDRQYQRIMQRYEREKGFRNQAD